MGVLEISAKPDPGAERAKVEELTNERLAGELETRLKAFYNPGVLNSSGTVRVAAEGNRLVVVPTSSQDLSEEAGVIGAGLDENKSPLLSTERPFADFIDDEMRQIFEFDYPRFMEESLHEVANQDPRYTFEEEKL